MAEIESLNKTSASTQTELDGADIELENYIRYASTKHLFTEKEFFSNNTTT